MNLTMVEYNEVSKRYLLINQKNKKINIILHYNEKVIIVYINGHHLY